MAMHSHVSYVNICVSPALCLYYHSLKQSFCFYNGIFFDVVKFTLFLQNLIIERLKSDTELKWKPSSHNC